MKRLLPCLFLLLWASGPVLAQSAGGTVRVGSKAFAESWILGEALAALARKAGAEVEHRSNLGGTDIVYAALKSGQVDLYPEYTGTIAEAILKLPGRPGLQELRQALRPAGIGVSESLGFNDGYGLALTAATADRLRLRKISDLAAHPELRIALTHEFLERKDGWPGLARTYGLPLEVARGIQHDLAYEALRKGQIDLTDVYTTDAQIARLGLRVLEDDRRFFPRYEAVLLYRLDLPQREPDAFRAMERLVGRIGEEPMIRANGRVILEKQSAVEAASALLRETLGASGAPAPARGGGRDVAGEILRNTGEHLRLVGLSLLAAVLAGIPLGVLAAERRWLAAVALSGTGVLQTIPSLALLAFLVPLMGQIGDRPALVALFLYSLLPIVRNTYTGLAGIPPSLSEAARALGLSPAAQLFRVRLPMASPSIMAGIKTSAVINVGTATLAALVGAGGLGEPIFRGLQTLNPEMTLQGAVPAAVLALAVQGLFDLLDRLVIPRGLRLTASGE